MDKLIFLDIDGVLNTGWYLREKHKQGLQKAEEKGQVSIEEFIMDGYGQIFDPAAVKALKKTIDQTNAKIVISSTWRFSGGVGKDNRLKHMQNMWKDRSLPGEVIDVTGVFKEVRGLEIRDYLRETFGYRSAYERSYVIIDDDSDMLYEQRNNFVQTDFNVGLTEEDADLAIKILLNT